jgi:hypothetical protein
MHRGTDTIRPLAGAYKMGIYDYYKNNLQLKEKEQSWLEKKGQSWLEKNR